MKKIFFMFVYLGITAAVLYGVISGAVIKDLGWPVTSEDYEILTESSLRSIDQIKEIYGASSLVLQHDAIIDGRSAYVKLADDYLIPFHETTGFDMDAAIGNMEALKDYCKGLDIPLYYVSFPSKAAYTDADPADYGVSSNEKELRGSFLNRIRETGIPVLDISEIFKEMGFSEEDIFYKSDSHWKTRMGLIAAHEIALYLSEHISRKVAPDLLEENRFRTTFYEQKWLGETARKVSATWAGGLEDYVLYEPDYDTSFMFYVPTKKISNEITFSDLIDRDLLRGRLDLYHQSLHYSYIKDAAEIIQIRNQNLSGAKILLIKDSFSVPVAPFLALTCGDLFWWDMRGNKYDVMPYIEKHQFDAVVIAYTDFWRGEMYDFK